MRTRSFTVLDGRGPGLSRTVEPINGTAQSAFVTDDDGYARANFTPTAGGSSTVPT